MSKTGVESATKGFKVGLVEPVIEPVIETVDTTAAPIETTVEVKPLKFHQKLLLVQRALDAPKHTGFNKHHKYKYHTSADVLNPLREACNENGLIVLATTESIEIIQGVYTKFSESGEAIKTGCGARVTVKVSVYDAESGESVSSCAPGYAEDGQDKAVAKAVTSAQKYAARLLFNLPSNETDLENDENEPPNYQKTYSNGNGKSYSNGQSYQPSKSTEPITDPQRRRLFAIAMKTGSENKAHELIKKVLKLHNCGDSTKEIKKCDYDNIVAKVESMIDSYVGADADDIPY